MITHLFFDLDNTLIDRNKAYKSYLYTFFKEQNLLTIWEQFNTQILEKDNQGYRPRKDFEEYLIKNYVKKKDFENYQKKYIVGDFVQPISIILKNKLQILNESYTIGILTNGSIINQQTKIKNAELDTFFQKQLIFISEDLGYSKPAIETFQFIEQKMQLLPSECLIIGDDLVNDIEGGQKAGWSTIQANSNQILSTIDDLLK